MVARLAAPRRRDAQRTRERILDIAMREFAARGYDGARVDAIVAACGMSKNLLYHYFAGKEALLVELLVGISTRLLTGGAAVAAGARDANAALDGLIEFHLEFALGEPDLIRIQDRDLGNLPTAAQRQVRRAQRRYVEIWVSVLRNLKPGLAESDARVMAHAAFGLLNSTPHSTKTADQERSREVLRAMTSAALRRGPG